MVVALTDLLAAAADATILIRGPELLNRCIQYLPLRLTTAIPINIFDARHVSANEHHIFRADNLFFLSTALCGATCRCAATECKQNETR